jgi:hypothetical protein
MLQGAWVKSRFEAVLSQTGSAEMAKECVVAERPFDGSAVVLFLPFGSNFYRLTA